MVVTARSRIGADVAKALKCQCLKLERNVEYSKINTFKPENRISETFPFFKRRKLFDKKDDDGCGRFELAMKRSRQADLC